jgi:hypothetical protein
MSTLSVGTIRSNTSAPPVVQNTSGTEIGAFCRAWVNFNGTTNVGGFCTISGSFNVTSVADNGTGDYTANLTTAMPDTNFSTALSIGISSASTNAWQVEEFLGGRTTTAIRFVAYRSTAATPRIAEDVQLASLSVFR